MTNSLKLLFGLIGLIIFLFEQIQANQLTSSNKAEEFRQINKFKLEIEELKKNFTNFYNYSIICGGKLYESRAGRGFTDNTIPVQYRNIVLNTYSDPELRLNKCPKWSYNVETVPKSGGMDSISIPENTKIGSKVYLLLSIDPESEPIYYFIRKAESEQDESDEIIFRVNAMRMGNTWLGEVLLDKKLDYEKKQSYNYLTYAYDGFNLIEKYSIIEITDVDDEKPEIKTNHPNYNTLKKQFEFKLFENMSIGEIVNMNKIIFTDIDTQSSQLIVRLTNLESGIADSPFSMNNNGELRIISSLDYETQKEYILKLNVKDTSGGFAEEIIEISIIDVPDMIPKFVEPKNLIQDPKIQILNQNFNFHKQLDLNEEGYVLFYENKLGPIFSIKAISQNKEPLGKIKYELVENQNPNYLNGFFELKILDESNDTWSLNCLKEINLNEKEEEYLQFVIRATESSNDPNDSRSFYADKRVTVKFINGDMCKPTFNKQIYEFEVVENVKQLIEPIYVNDCDHGTNGKIFLSTTNDEFTFKINQVYRYSKLGIEMARSYDYEENLTQHGHKIEFQIIARGSNQSLNKYETRALVIVRILDLNEFMPKFVLPPPAYFIKDGIPTEQQQRIFLYNVAERKDFVLDVKAEDQDKGGEGELFYFCRYLHPDDTFEIIHSYNSTSKVFNILVPGRYFDASSRIPIAFVVFVEDNRDEPKLRNEIIIYLRPQSDEQKSAYFEFSHYEFKLEEKPQHYQTFTLKLINDNLSVSKIVLEELLDPLKLITPDFEESLISAKDMIRIVEGESTNDAEQEINNELLVVLYLTDPNRDFDDIYIKNNKSDVYEYKLRVRSIEKPELFNDVTILFKLIDSNDNKPEIINLINNKVSYLNATLREDFAPHTLIDIGNSHFIPKIADLDFSSDYGLRSIYFKINDTRFYIDNEFISAELENPNAKSVSLLIRVLTSSDKIDKKEEPVIWLNVTWEDNYFNRKLNKFSSKTFWSKSILVKVHIIDSIINENTDIFDQTEYVFSVDEHITGSIGRIGNEKLSDVRYKIDGNSQEYTDLLNEYFELSGNLLSLKKEVDYEMGQRFFNFSIIASLSTSSAKFRADIVILVNDINDEKPNFSQKEYKFYLNNNKNKAGNEIGSVYATDMDKEDWNNGLEFKTASEKFQLVRIENGSEQFLQGANIVIKQDLIENEKYSFEIEVNDKSGHGDTSTVLVVIDSQHPFSELKWSNEIYQASIKENSPSDTPVIKVSMSPIDIKTNKYEIGYKIIDQNEYFKIDELTGQITTSTKKLDRENPNFFEQSKERVLFVQSYVKIDSTIHWSNMATVKIEIIDENDQLPIFVHPFDNQTQVTRFKPENIYTFMATDSDSQDKIKYELTEQVLAFNNTPVNFPFKLDSITGVLSFELNQLKNDDYFMLLSQEAELVRVKLSVKAEDLDGKSTTRNLLVDLSLNRLLKKAPKGTLAHLTPIIYKFEPKIPEIEKINDTIYSIKESVEPNTIVADLNSYLDKSNVRLRMIENLKIVPLKNDSINPELYFRYDHVTSGLKLVRKLDFDIVKNLSLSLVGEDDFRVDLEFLVQDSNNKKPNLELDEQEVNKYGKNLVLVSVNNLDHYLNSISKVVSSTPLPPRQPLPAIPEMNIPVRPLSSGEYYTPELDANKASLIEFNNLKIIKAYRILDSDLENKFSVAFVHNETNESILKSFVVKTNETHILFEKNNEVTPEDEANLNENSHKRFKIELSDGVNKVFYTGELYVVDARQLQRLTTFIPDNGRYRASLYRSSVAKAKIDVEPILQIENQFPYDIIVRLEGKHEKYFDVTPKIVKSSIINFGPTELIISLKDSLEKYEDDIVGLASLDFNVQISTSNSYLNSLLSTIGNMKVKIDLRRENKFEPRIDFVSPESKTIRLDEGQYAKKEIAKILAYDRDKGDPGRVNYYLIGNSNLLEINQTTGVVYLNGLLDAESEQTIVFFCYARDLAPAPFGRNSELKRFEIIINDINEFSPVLQPGLTSLTLKEALEEQSPELTTLNEFRYDCYDRDLDSQLEITLNSIRYVSKHDTFKYMDESTTNSQKLQIKDIFKLVYDNNTQSKNYKSAHLAYTNKLDYEKLYRPSETLIRIDVSCTDGKYESKSKLLVKIEDLNDNRPIFLNKNLIIHKNESNLLETIVRVEALDMDLSPQYGNQSLKFRINKCQPNNYDIYIDERTGEISSKLLLDLDTDEIIKKRTEIYNNQLNYTEQIEFFNKYNRIDCNISVYDAGLYTSPNELSLSDTMNLTILINNMNDNPPEINLDNQNEQLIEIKEGEQTRGAILQKISVFDKDGASGLECIFGTGHKTSDPFELRTSMDIHDPHTTWCILKVRDDMVVDYDIVKKSIYLLELVVNDNIPQPVYPNKGVSRAQIRVRVLPVNNKPPLFVNGNEETFYVLDSIRPGTLIGTVLATDMENPNPDRLIYKFDTNLSTKTYDKFDLKPSQNSTNSYWGSVGIFTKSKLEVNQSPYILTVIAFDGPVELKDTLSSRKLIKIFVLNKGSMSVWINETNGLPVDYYLANIEEELPADTLIIKVKANIPDYYKSSRKNIFSDEIIYSIVDEENQESNKTNPFYTIDPHNGEIRTTDERIDFENKDLEKIKMMRNIKVKASSMDGYFNYVTHVSINILDINDNKPIFEFDQYKFCVVENSTESKIGIVRAIDLDSSVNSLVKYKIDSDIFQINENTGEIIVVNGHKIDRETNDKIKVKVTAYDSDDLEDNLELDICVLDINDNIPEFYPLDESEFEIEENSIDFKFKLNASDSDLAENGTIFFFFDKSINSIDISQKFRIDPISGLIELISPLDYEYKNKYELIITCSDKGFIEPLKSNIKLTIKVIDINDNEPKFTLSSQNKPKIYVNEAAAPDSILTKVEAIDLDQTVSFRQVVYQIKSISSVKSGELNKLDNDLLIINSDGQVTLGTDSQLDYQKIKEYLIEIEAFDSDKPEFKDSFKLSLNVEPSNDKIPFFENTNDGMKYTVLYRRNLAESRDNDYIIDIVKAVDPNQYGIKYFLDSVVEIGAKNQTKSVPIDLFTVGIDDGAVKTRKTRSFYSGDSYKLNIRAVSILNESLNTNLDLIVKVDSNADSLFEERVIEVSIDENLPSNTFITRLKPKVTDRSLRYKMNNQFSTPIDLYSKWFKIDFITGIIKTNDESEIDCEVSNEILLSIDVVELGDNESKEETIENLLVKIKINDLNDNSPIFDFNYLYEPIIIEDSDATVRIDRLLTKFKAIDYDKTINYSSIQYKIVSTKNQQFDLFKLVFETNGEVSLYKKANKNLDRENPSIGSLVKLTIRAENTFDPVKFTNKEISIKLIDLNDNAPTLLDKEPESSISIAENYRLNEKLYQVKAVDLDEPNTVNSELIYEISPKSSYVEIDSQGFLYLIKELDYETHNKIDLNINIFDKSEKPLTTVKRVIINILNINDNYPMFENLPNDFSNKYIIGKNEQTCSLNLPENLERKIVYRFGASDLDKQPGNFNYDVIDLKAYNRKLQLATDLNNDLFAIDSVSGELKLIGSLDREKIDSYILKINLKDQEINGLRLETKIECTINILDVNDNPPKFSDFVQTEFKILPIVNERTLIGYFVATDADLGQNSTIEYFLKDSKNIFEIDSNGYLFINLRKLTDKNHDLDDLYSLEIVARDMGVPQRLESSLKLTIKIDPNYFTFDQQKTDKLDLQTPDIIHLQENSMKGTKIGQVKVLNSFNSIIQESKSNQNRKIDLKFSLLTCNETFKIDEQTGMIEVFEPKRLDYERTKEFMLLIEARETQKMSSFSKVRIGSNSFMVKLINVNDNPVVFKREIYETSLSETQKHLPFDVNLNELIQLSDLDLETTKSQVVNQLNPIDVRLNDLDSSSFKLVQLNPLLYKIESIEKFDYEFKKRYEFTISAWDGIYKTHSKVIVNLIDDNDNKPVFEKEEYIFKIDENSPMNTEVGYVIAKDADATLQNNQTFYKITNSHENIFGLNEKTGLVYVRDSNRLDRETTESFNLTIICYNTGKPEYFDTTKVIIYLNDLNDQSPKFDSSILRINIKEKFTSLPRLLGKVHATDNDLNDNGTVNYFIDSVNGKAYESSEKNDNQTDFYMDKINGHLYLNSYLDADSNVVEKSYEIKIAAKDLGGNKDECLILINLIDINDKAPIIVNPTQTEFKFDENSLIEDPLFEVKAYDPDYRQSQIQYFLDQDLSNDWTNFRIDQTTGKVYSNVMFDFEIKREFNLRILCKDSGIMIEDESIQNDQIVDDLLKSAKFELSTDIKIKIKINDLDDNEPEFSRLDLDLSVNMSENLEVNSIITVLPIARDRDTLPENTNIKYFIMSGNEDSKFKLNETSGELVLLDELERKEKSIYELVVRSTSKQFKDIIDLHQESSNDLSVTNVKLNVVKDKLFIEFVEQNYYISVQLNFDGQSNNQLEHKEYKFENLETKQTTKRSVDSNLFKQSAIFYSKSHLIKRKLKRNVKFNIEMLQVIRSNENIATKLPLTLVNTLNHSYADEHVTSLDQSSSNYMFSIDEVNGKVYINREFVKKEDYKVGDRFMLTVSASSTNMYSDETENTLAQLTVRLTDKDYSFIMPLKRINMQEIIFECLNPLKPKYIPRILEADGVKIAIQDLVTSKNKLTGENSYNLILQVEAKQEQRTMDLDFFANLWKNYSSSNRFLNEINGGFIDRQPVSDARQYDRSDLLDMQRPFYLSWLFWLLCIIGLLLIIILVFFVFCIKITKKHHKRTKKPGIIIEYPPGVNPVYNDGVLNLTKKNKKNTEIRRSNSGTNKVVPVEIKETQPIIEYEEKEFQMDFEEEIDV